MMWIKVNSAWLNYGLALGAKKAVILQNHGLLAVGRSIVECIFWFVTMEHTCQSQLLEEARGKEPIKIGHEVALQARDYKVGFPLAGYFSFQPMWQDTAYQQPDFMDIAVPEPTLAL